MKWIWLLIALVVCVSQSNAQTAVPFYGFELSNYEVGDTLEYETSVQQILSSSQCPGKQLFVIIGKTNPGPDMIEYSIRFIDWHHCFGAPWSYQEVDTITLAISNDTIINNTNNILAGEITVANDNWLSTNMTFDTVGGLKHLSGAVSGFEFTCVYDALQNLGLTYYKRGTSEEIKTHTLIYARTQQYGVYGSYEPIYLSMSRPDSENTLLDYDAVTKTLRTMNGVSQFDELRLFDVAGRCVLIATPNDKLISLVHLNVGMYFYQLSGKQFASGKILLR